MPAGKRGRRGAPAWACAVLLSALLLGPAPARAMEECFLVTDLDTGRVLAKQGLCATRHSPASTFKIPLSLMGFDAGILKGAGQPVLDPPPGADTSRAVTRGPQTPQSWMRNSVVWYSQVLARELGPERIKAYLDGFAYGTLNISGTPGRAEPIAHFWLSSSLRISPREQVDFLRRMLKGELKVSEKAVTETMALLAQEEQPAGWQLFGKTGTGSSPGADGLPDPNRPLGWFVGFAQKGGRTAVFARFISLDQKGEEGLGAMARRQAVGALAPVLAAQQ
ncbi:penicillin-binding transpeptidase domain-containing protein [Xanthobacter pseudotagetidis]|uniref:penicillin-binding transpeptidase domain-containing protein n=1 Tax=Xanthobacter pseudotagetidis TaxID=3119911 RepID=UPI00372CA7BF